MNRGVPTGSNLAMKAEEGSYAEDEFETPLVHDGSTSEEFSYGDDEFESAPSTKKRSMEILLALERHLEEELRLEKELSRLCEENNEKRSSHRGIFGANTLQKNNYSITKSCNSPSYPVNVARTIKVKKAPYETCTLGTGTVYSLCGEASPSLSFSRVERGSSGDTHLLFFSNLDKKGRTWSERSLKAKTLKNATRMIANQIVTIDASASTKMQATGDVDSIYMLPSSISKQIEGRAHRSNAPCVHIPRAERDTIAQTQTLLGNENEKLCSLYRSDKSIPGPGKYSIPSTVGSSSSAAHTFYLSAPRGLDGSTEEHRKHRKGVSAFEYGRHNPAKSAKTPPLFYENTFRSDFDKDSSRSSATFGTSTRGKGPGSGIGALLEEDLNFLKELKDDAKITLEDLKNKKQQTRKMESLRKKAMFVSNKKGATFGSKTSRYSYTGLKDKKAVLSLADQLALSRKKIYYKHAKNTKTGCRIQRKTVGKQLQTEECYDSALGAQRLSKKRSEPCLSFGRAGKLKKT